MGVSTKDSREGNDIYSSGNKLQRYRYPEQMKATLHGRNLERGQISRATVRKDQGSGRFRCVLRFITRASSKVHISCISK